MKKEFKTAVKFAKKIGKSATPGQKRKRIHRWAESAKRALGA